LPTVSASPETHELRGNDTGRSRKKGEEGLLFLKKQQKTLAHFSFGLSGQARPSFAKVFWFFFSKKNRFLPRGLCLAFRPGTQSAALCCGGTPPKGA
jgi:hypothetical protein